VKLPHDAAGRYSPGFNSSIEGQPHWATDRLLTRELVQRSHWRRRQNDGMPLHEISRPAKRHSVRFVAAAFLLHIHLLAHKHLIIK
jgi:hypothetical protein